MALNEIAPGEHLPTSRGEVVVVVPVFGAHEHVVRCLASILTHTAADVAVLLTDDASPDPKTRHWIETIDVPNPLYWLQQPSNLGFVGNCNSAFRATAPADVVLVNSDVIVAAKWLDGLRNAAYSDSGIATATALSNHSSILSVPNRNAPSQGFAPEVNFEAAAAALRTSATRSRPRIPTAIGHCVWIKRSALELVGNFDSAFAPAYGEEVDFSLRCSEVGLQHVAADDVLVLHHGKATHDRDATGSQLQADHEVIINSRYPHYEEMIELTAEQSFSPLAGAIGAASRAVRRSSVTFDGRCLNSILTGTQRHAIELIAAVADTREFDVRVVVPPDLGDYAKPILESFENVEILDARSLSNDLKPTDVVHRTFQVSDPSELSSLAKLGNRLILTNQDLIAYRNPSYHSSAQSWQTYRRLAAESLSLASMVLFFSNHARDDALSEELVAADRTRVVPLGTHHRRLGATSECSAPSSPVPLASRPFLLCIGTTFHHKNRLFAIRLFDALRRRHNWEGRLILAGPNVRHGSSLSSEAEWLASRPDTASGVVTLPAVTEAEKNWLYDNCSAVVYPTTYEGFGLIPFEAAEAGKPTLFAPTTALGEFLPPEAASLLPWDEDASADQVIQVLRDPAAAEALTARILAAAVNLTWDESARGVLAAYEIALSKPASELMRLEGQYLARDHRYWGFRNSIDPAGLSLIDPEKPLLPHDVQHTIAGIARRPATRSAFFAGLRGLRRVVGAPQVENGAVHKLNGDDPQRRLEERAPLR